MSQIPNELRYTKSHEWALMVRLLHNTDFAQDALGDVVYFDAPEVGDDISKGELFGEVESVKAVSDILSIRRRDSFRQ